MSATSEPISPRTGSDSRLPNGWRLVPLSSACRQDRTPIEPRSKEAVARPYLSLEHIEGETGRILPRPEGSPEDVGKSTTFAFDERHVLYGKLRPYLNKVATPGFAGRCTTEAIPLLPSDGVDREFLAWLLRRRETVNAAMREKTGSRMPRADMDELLSLLVPLPPFDAQKRIVSKLGERMAVVRRAEAAAHEQIGFTTALRKAFVRRVFLSAGASDWPSRPLRDLCVGDGQYGTSEKSSDDSSGVPVLRMGNIIDGRLDWTNLRYMQFEGIEERKYLLAPGDVIFNRTNSAELVGKTAVFDTNRRAVFASYLIRFRMNPDEADPYFVAAFINSYAGRAFITANMGRAIGQVNISASTMHRMPVPCPPVEEQKRLVASLRDAFAGLDTLGRHLLAQYETVEALPNALLRQALSGGV